MAVSVGPKICIRYKPTFRIPVFGSLVCIIGKVKKGPPSSGQHLSTGNFVTSGFFIITSWQSPFPLIVFGIQDAIDPNAGNSFSLSIKFSFGDVRCLIRFSISKATSSSLSLPSAHAIRCSVPIELIKSGNSVPVFSKSRAGPYCFEIRSVISVISRYGFTYSRIRTNCPFDSSVCIQCWVFLYIIFFSRGTTRWRRHAWRL